MSPYSSNDPFAVLASLSQEPLPSIDHLESEAQALSPLSSDAKFQFKLGAIEAANSSKGEGLFADTGRLVATNALNTDQALFNLRQGLARIGADGSVSRSLYSQIQCLVADAATQHKRFTDLLSLAKTNIVGNAKMVAQDFYENLLPYLADKNESPRDKAATLDEFITGLAKPKDLSLQCNQELMSFSQNLAALTKGFEEIFSYLAAGESQQVREMLGSIVDIDRQIQSVTLTLSGTPWAAVDEGVGHLLQLCLKGGPAAARLGVVLPVAGYIRAGVGGGSAATHTGSLLELYKMKARRMDEYWNMSRESGAVIELRGLLFRAAEGVNDTLRDLQLVVAVHSVLSRELNDIKSAWKANEQSACIEAYTDSTASIFKSLCSMLDAYQRASRDIHRSHD